MTHKVPALVVHGGAWDIPPHLYQDCRDGCREAAQSGWAVLAGGGSALDAVEHAVLVLEDDSTFDAGRGAVLNSAGEIELDAIIMDGSNLDVGAVIGVKYVSNPISLARLVMIQSQHAVLAGEGAEAFAAEQKQTRVPNSDHVIAREQERWLRHRNTEDGAPGSLAGTPRGTVGAVALDAAGDLAVATSTGGTFYKRPGRVGDSPLVGCGAYADNHSGAVSATGQGESLMKVVISKSVCDLMWGGMSAQDAAEAGIALLERRTGGRGGLIVVGRRGDIGIAHNTSHLAYASVRGDSFVSRVSREFADEPG